MRPNLPFGGGWLNGRRLAGPPPCSARPANRSTRKFPIEHAVLHGSTVYLIDPNGGYWSKMGLGWKQKPNGQYGIGPKARYSYNHEGLADGARRFTTLPGVQQVTRSWLWRPVTTRRSHRRCGGHPRA